MFVFRNDPIRDESVEFRPARAARLLVHHSGERHVGCVAIALVLVRSDFAQSRTVAELVQGLKNRGVPVLWNLVRVFFCVVVVLLVQAVRERPVAVILYFAAEAT